VRAGGRGGQGLARGERHGPGAGPAPAVALCGAAGRPLPLDQIRGFDRWVSRDLVAHRKVRRHLR
jgi:hypothetical protein